MPNDDIVIAQLSQKRIQAACDYRLGSTAREQVKHLARYRMIIAPETQRKRAQAILRKVQELNRLMIRHLLHLFPNQGITINQCVMNNAFFHFSHQQTVRTNIDQKYEKALLQFCKILQAAATSVNNAANLVTVTALTQIQAGKSRESAIESALSVHQIACVAGRGRTRHPKRQQRSPLYRVHFRNRDQPPSQIRSNAASMN